jgi:hypothetical protein
VSAYPKVGPAGVIWLQGGINNLYFLRAKTQWLGVIYDVSHVYHEAPPDVNPAGEAATMSRASR